MIQQPGKRGKSGFRGQFSKTGSYDAECAAGLELWKHTELTDAVYLSLGEHLGGAIIADGKIQRGRTGRTGAFEHMTLEKGGRQCYCGKLGCVECYCSADALLHSGEALPDFLYHDNSVPAGKAQAIDTRPVFWYNSTKY